MNKGPLGIEGDMMSSVGLYEMWLIRSNFIKTTYDISLDSQISFLPLGFSPTTTIKPIFAELRQYWFWGGCLA